MNKRKLMRFIGILLIASNVLFASGFVLIGIKYDVFDTIYAKITGTKLVSERDEYYTVQTSLYDVYPNKDVEIVMLGDSLTFKANWNELLIGNSVVNRGIESDTTDGILKRLSYVYNQNPELCFVLAGINDLRYGKSVADTFENYKKIILNLKSNNITPVIQSVLYTSNQHKGFKKLNSKVEELNKLLKGFADENDTEYLDLNQIVSKEKVLDNLYTYDGLHLLGDGYEMWSREVKRIINTLNKQ